LVTLLKDDVVCPSNVEEDSDDLALANLTNLGKASTPLRPGDLVLIFSMGVLPNSSDLTKSESVFSKTILLGEDSTGRDLELEVKLTVDSTVVVELVVVDSVVAVVVEVVEIVIGTSSGKMGVASDLSNTILLDSDSSCGGNVASS